MCVKKLQVQTLVYGVSQKSCNVRHSVCQDPDWTYLNIALSIPIDIASVN